MPKKKYYLEAIFVLGQAIHTTKSYWDYIANKKHPEVKGQRRKAIATIEGPDIIKQSLVDIKIFVYYCRYGDKYFSVVAKHLNEEVY